MSELHPPHGRLSELLLELSTRCSHEKVSLEKLIELMSVRGHALLTLFLGVPFVLPMPVPGLSTLLGAVVVLIGLAMLRGRPPWVPKRWKQYTLPGPLVAKICRAAGKVIRSIEHVVKPRGRAFVRHEWNQRVVGAMLAACGFLLALPLPPGTNFPPGLAILVLSLAALEEDSVLLVVGHVLMLANLLLFGALAVFGFDGVRWLFAYWSGAT